MALYLLKPVLWNKRGYVRPSGVPAAEDSYPGKYGFGHEEWNNSPRMEFTERGKRYRVFHTEGVKKAPVDEHAGQTFVLMTASHDGVQQLVGVAGNAMFIGGEQYDGERQRLAKLLDLKGLWRDAWDLQRVKSRFDNDPVKFRRHYDKEVAWAPNWICPIEHFLWLGEPVTLDPQRIIGSNWLPKMFSGYKALDRQAAALVMNTVPVDQRSPTWNSLLDAMRSAPDAPTPPVSDEDERASTRLTTTLARIGQGAFRDSLLDKWEGRCAVTGLTCVELLRASHVKPWSHSNRQERLDRNNGLLLAAHLDALFDKGLISFDDSGKMLLSRRLPAEEVAEFGLPRSLRDRPEPAMQVYLHYHRQRCFDRAVDLD